ncbi:MAG: hypothetical protein QOE43_535 [Gaiellaceae bacterium]|nr:hypothetical protein [Gaiellaceae bacterium]
MARKVRDPRGGTWTVRRSWLDRKRRLRGTALTRDQHYQSGAAAALLLFLPFLVAYLVLTAVDFVVSAVRHGRGRPWRIEARLNGVKREVLTWRVAGWQRSKQAIDEAARALARGEELTSFGEPERSVGGAG